MGNALPALLQVPLLGEVSHTVMPNVFLKAWRRRDRGEVMVMLEGRQLGRWMEILFFYHIYMME